jgi:hypothetical protein
VPPTEPPAPQAPAPTPAPPAAATAKDDKDAEIEKWQALSRKHERRHLEALGFDPDQVEAFRAQLEKDPDAIARRAGGYDELATRLQTLEAERDAARAEALRSSVAAAKGVPVELLSGSTQEELEAAAEKLLAFKGVKPPAPPANGQGALGAGVHGDGDMSATDIVNEAMKR